MISNVQILHASPAPTEVSVKSRFLVYRNRVETETDLLVGKPEDLLRLLQVELRLGAARRDVDRDLPNRVRVPASHCLTTHRS